MQIFKTCLSCLAVATSVAACASSASAQNPSMGLPVPSDEQAPATTTEPQSPSWLNFAQLSKATINPATPGASAAPMAPGSSHSGCVGNYSSVGNDFISWTGNMVGCARGNLHLHTWLERNGSLYIDGHAMTARTRRPAPSPATPGTRDPAAARG